MPSRVSVVIATRNRPANVHRLLGQLVGQLPDPADLEVVVVDDGSSPPLVLPEGRIATRLVRTQGVERSAARNEGAAAATAPLLLFLDDDMIPSPGLVAAHLAAQARWPGALAVGAIDLPEAVGRPFIVFRQRLEREAIPASAGPVSSRTFCTAANMSIARSRFLELSGFDPGLVSSEDQDLALRFTAAGGTIVHVPEARVVHDDANLDIRSYCRRVEWGMATLAPFLTRWPDLPENKARVAVHGPVQLGTDSPGRVVRKVVTIGLSGRVATSGLFRLSDWVERTGPRSLLPAIYRVLLAVHLRQGFRRAQGKGS